MERRIIGDAVIFIELDEDRHDRAAYRGRIKVGSKTVWVFDELYAPRHWSLSWDSDEAFDEMASSAVSFGSSAEITSRDIASAIEEATAWAMNEDGSYDVIRPKNVLPFERNPPEFSQRGSHAARQIESRERSRGRSSAEARRIAEREVYSRAGKGDRDLVRRGASMSPPGVRPRANPQSALKRDLTKYLDTLGLGKPNSIEVDSSHYEDDDINTVTTRGVWKLPGNGYASVTVYYSKSADKLNVDRSEASISWMKLPKRAADTLSRLRINLSEPAKVGKTFQLSTRFTKINGGPTTAEDFANEVIKAVQ